MYSLFVFSNDKRKTGGDTKECDILGKVGYCIENVFPQNVGEEMTQSYDVNLCRNAEKSNGGITEIDERKLIISQHIDPSKCETFESLMDAFYRWWTVSLNYKGSTGIEHVKSLRRLSTHPVYPVDFFDLRHQIEQIINQLLYRDKYEYAEKRKRLDNPAYGRHQLDNFLKAVDAFGRSIGINGLRRIISPYLKLCKHPKPRQPNIPSPIAINVLVHYPKYSKEPVVNAEVKTLLLVGFSIGARPSELYSLKTTSIKFRTCEIVKQEQKTGLHYNYVSVESGVLNSHQQPSVINWLEIHRPKLMERLGFSKEQDEGWLFPNPRTGKRFTSSSRFYSWLCDFVKPVLKEQFPTDDFDFYPQIMRTWCAHATLVKTKVENRVWDKREVQYLLGHDSGSDTLEDYVRLAKKLHKLYPFNWFRAILKFHPNSKNMKNLLKEDNSPSQEWDDQKLTNGQNRSLLIKTTEETVSAPDGESYRFLLLVISTNHSTLLLLIFRYSLTKPFFSFYAPLEVP